MKELFIAILWSLPFIMLCLMCAKLNLAPRYRARQVWMPLVALLYCLIVITGRAYIQDWLNTWTNQYQTLMSILKALMIEVDYASIEIYIFNMVLVAIFFTLKLALLPWMYYKCGKGTFSQQVYMHFYVLDPTVRYDISQNAGEAGNEEQAQNPDNPEGNDANTADHADDNKNADNQNNSKSDKQNADKPKPERPPQELRIVKFFKKILGIKDKKKQIDDSDAEAWVVKKSYKQFTFFYRGFYIALFIVSCLLFILSQYKADWDIFKSVFYPVFGIIILGEVVFFLSGLEEPDVDAVLKEPEKPKVVLPPAQLDIREDYHKLYGNRILKDDNNDNFTDDDSANAPVVLNPYSSAANDLLARLKSGDDADDQLVAGYFNAVEGDLDENYISCCRELIHGKSVVVYTPFYQDLTHYIMLPIMRQLLRYKKCLVVVGRESAVDDVKSWLEDAIFGVLDTHSLWNVEILSDVCSTADIGILRFSDIYHLEIQRENRAFLSQVGLVLLIEPTRILATGQMGLSLLVSQCGAGEDNGVVYCACDRNCDGLVDVLSHALKASFTEVLATPANQAHHNLHMYWNADGDYLHHKILPEVSHYLGVGTEIAAVAWRHHISPVKWLSCDKFPVLDMKWIAGQYYKAICQYAGLPLSQSALNDAFQVDPNLWNGSRKNKLFYIVEDEFRNLFEMTRVYSSRATGEGFVNILSEHYLLRDYMVDNVSLFVSDPKAIPAIVPDYARTERNTILKLIMLMTTGKVSKDYIDKELALCGIVTENTEETLHQLINRHCGIREDEPFSVLLSEETLEDGIKHHIVQYYEIRPSDPLYAYAEKLKAAYYISEDEHGDKYYIGAKLYGHVYQSFLPGQFITSNGKYYQVQQISTDSGVIVRRAADHINQREYYRQVRKVEMHNWVEDAHIGSQRTVGQLEISRGYADISIHTRGYLQMRSPADFAHAQLIDINQIPDRGYLNKQVLRLKFKFASEDVRYTICLLLNEIFSTIYPEASSYIFAVTKLSPDFVINGMLKYAVYDFDGETEDDCIYIIEDSEIDLGLVVSAERYFGRFLGIICEVLSWHIDKMLEPPVVVNNEPEPEPLPEPEPEPEPENLGLIQRIVKFFKQAFGKMAEPEVTPHQTVAVLPPVKAKKLEYEPTEYQKHCFLKFGGDEVPEVLAVEDTVAWLTLDGYDKNPLHMVRKHDG